MMTMPEDGAAPSVENRINLTKWRVNESLYKAGAISRRICRMWVCECVPVCVQVCVCKRSCVYIRSCVVLFMGVLFVLIKCNVFNFPGTVMRTKNFSNYSARSTTLSKIRAREMLLLLGYPGHWP